MHKNEENNRYRRLGRNVSIEREILVAFLSNSHIAGCGRLAKNKEKLFLGAASTVACKEQNPGKAAILQNTML